MCLLVKVTTSPKIKQTLSLSPTHIIEEANVDNIGRFQAASNGRIHIVFADRTFLDMQADLSPRLERMGISHNQVLYYAIIIYEVILMSSFQF